MKSNLLITTQNDVAQRLDNFLLKNLGRDTPKSYIYRLIRSGQIRVNSGRIKPDYKLVLGDTVRLPPFLSEKEKKIRPHLSYSSKELLASRIIYEDDQLLVYNKPAGEMVHSNDAKTSISTIDYLCEYLGYEVYLVHRIDKDTSGCLLIAKNRQILKNLQDQFRDHKILKFYQLIVDRGFKFEKRVVDTPLEVSHNSGFAHVKTSEDGVEAKTIFHRLVALPTYSLLLAKLDTGRTHQIRVHISSIGYPIIGDSKYSNDISSANDGKMLLHSWALGFKHPITKEFIMIKSDIPKHFSAKFDPEVYSEAEYLANEIISLY